MKWACTTECKTLMMKCMLLLSWKNCLTNCLRQALDACDSGCPNQHYVKYVHNATIDLQGHPFVCSNDGGCYSKMRILRSAATHFPVLATLLRLVYSAVNSHQCVQNIDNALCAGDFHTLMEITKLTDFETLLSNEVKTTHEQCTEIADSGLVQAGIEIQLLSMLN